MASVDTRAIEGEIDRIRSLGLEDLRREWRRLNHGEPPRISRDLLVLALGYRLQEIALSVADQDRQKDHRSALVGSALLWAISGG
jgi:hypothetical protein